MRQQRYAEVDGAAYASLGCEKLGDSVAGWSLSHYFGSLGDGADSGE